MGKVTTAEARKQLADLFNRAAYGKERITVTRHGKAVAGIVPREDLDLIKRLRKIVRQREIEAAKRDVEVGDAAFWQALKNELGL